MITVRGFLVRSRLDAPADDVWAAMLTPAGINHELAPWLRMTVPAGLVGATPETVTPGQPLGRSWIFLFGVLPMEYDDLVLARLDARGFVESSSMLTLKTWRHERHVERRDGGCEVIDRVGWRARIPGGDAIAGLVAPALFRHRHARLIARYGGERREARAIDVEA